MWSAKVSLSELEGCEMCTAQTFRIIAENQRRLAALSDIPWMRDRYLAAADKWDVLAQAKGSTEAGEIRSKERATSTSARFT